jgi:deoxyadenosine/deoxycytidine kinase
MGKPVVGIVGPCAAGKTTLVARLNAIGYETHHIAQEHSYVPYMWERITHPDILIYLQVSYPLTLSRRNMDWTEAEYNEQLLRLRHAREHADLIIDTDRLTINQVVGIATDYLKEFG